MSHAAVTCQLQFAVTEAARECCGTSVKYYRTCGAGCSLIIAYCDSHGGDAEAAKQMHEHVKQTHPEKIEEKR